MTYHGITLLSVGDRKKSLRLTKGRIHEISWVFDWGLCIQNCLWEIVVESICDFKMAGNCFILSDMEEGEDCDKF